MFYAYLFLLTPPWCTNIGSEAYLKIGEKFTFHYFIGAAYLLCFSCRRTDPYTPISHLSQNLHLLESWSAETHFLRFAIFKKKIVENAIGLDRAETETCR